MRGHRRGFRVPGRCLGRRRVIALELEDCEVRDERGQREERRRLTNANCSAGVTGDGASGTHPN
jgi:hypothetical protein